MIKNRSSSAFLSLALISSVAFGLTLVGAAYSFSQEPQGPPPGQHEGPGHGPRHHGPNAEFETRMLTKRLGLSADQAAKIEPILAAQNQQLKALRPQRGSQSDTGTPPDFKAIHEQTKTIMDQTRQQVEAVLTPEQQTEFAKIQEHRGPGGPRGNWQGKPGNGSGE